MLQISVFSSACGIFRNKTYVCRFFPFVSAVFAPKVIGVAIARYDFSSRDTRELSLQEGDVVKIYTKSGANGWWRGEVNGRVSERPGRRAAAAACGSSPADDVSPSVSRQMGWFPSTYVEEGEE